MRPRAARLWLLLLVAGTAWVYAPVSGFEFVMFDDDRYVSENWRVQDGLTLDNLAWAFGARIASNWHPLTWLSYMLDHDIHGLDPGGYHLTNLLLHLAATATCFLALERMTRASGRSLLVAALFALHPLHVESVAWIAERKDVLAGLLFMLALLGYAHYAERPGSRARYLGVLVPFAFGLLAKPMLVTLPLLLLLLDFWPLGRFERERRTALVLEKAPLLLLSAASSAVTFAVQDPARGMLDLPLEIRILNALLAYVWYLTKALWPTELAAFYPHPGPQLSVAAALASGAVLAGASLLSLRARARCPYLLVGWFWFAGMLVPVIGIVQIGAQAFADRYAYLPLLGLFLAVAWGGTDVARRLAAPAWLPRALSLAAVLAFAFVSRVQLGHWRDSEALFSRGIAVTADNALMQRGLGVVLSERGEHERGIAHLREALRLAPDDAGVYDKLGLALAYAGRTDEARRQWEEALRLQPEHASALFNLGQLLAREGSYGEAIDYLSRAVLADPSDLDAHMSLAVALASLGRPDEALMHVEWIVAVAPDHPGAVELLEALRRGNGGGASGGGG